MSRRPMTAGRLDLTAQGRFRYPLKTVAAAIYADSPDTSGGPNGAAQHWHVSPEAAEGGNIALIETGDKIVIDIPNRIALK